MGAIYFQYLYYTDILNQYLGDVYFSFLEPGGNMKETPIDYIHEHRNNGEEETRRQYKLKLGPVGYMHGIKLTYNKIDQRTLINILQYYLILNEYYIYKNGIYVKIKNSMISYKLVGSIIEVLYDKFQENVVLYYTSNFKYYFRGFDFNYLLTTYFVKTKYIIEVIRDISTQRIAPDFSLIEFSDGVYSIKCDRFIPNKGDNKIFNNKISTIKFYDKSYSRTRQSKPKVWIKSLLNALNVKKGNGDFISICMYIINTLHRDIFDKKPTLFIHGKTTLILNILINCFGSDNVGSVINSKNFK